jgi:hypothetical protein
MLQGYGQFLLHFEKQGGGVSLELHSPTLTKHRHCAKH